MGKTIFNIRKVWSGLERMVAVFLMVFGAFLILPLITGYTVSSLPTNTSNLFGFILITVGIALLFFSFRKNKF